MKRTTIPKVYFKHEESRVDVLPQPPPHYHFSSCVTVIDYLWGDQAIAFCFSMNVNQKEEAVT